MLIAKRTTVTAQRGFTLVELIMVIVLISIISSVALPRFFSRNDFNERALFDDTLNAIRYAQKLAVATGCQTRFTVNSNSFAVLREDSCGSGSFSSNLAVLHPSIGQSDYTGSEAGISITATQINTTFNALGQADIDNTVTVGNKEITIISATGFCYDSTP